MNFSFFKEVGESETKVLWYLSNVGGSTKLPLLEFANLLSMDFQQLRRTTNKLQEKGFIRKHREKAGRSAINTYELIRVL